LGQEGKKEAIKKEYQWELEEKRKKEEALNLKTISKLPNKFGVIEEDEQKESGSSSSSDSEEEPRKRDAKFEKKNGKEIPQEENRKRQKVD